MVTAGFLPHDAVDRPELCGRLDESLTKRLTVIVAPAGTGKSVLLNQWVHANHGLRVAYLEIGPQDDDPTYFARRLLAEAALLETDRKALQASIALGAGGLGDSFINELTDELQSVGTMAVILDDFHRLTNHRLEADLETLIARFPPNVHTVIATRAELGGDTTRYRLAGELLEIRQADLAMSYADSAELLARSSGRELSIQNVSALVDKTEGWAAGLQLAGLTIKIRENPDEFIADFSGSDRLVGDYLSQQVLNALPLEQRRSLLRLSSLDAMTSELVGVATREPEAQRLFEQLERESLFLIPLDDRREWFRFHHLFLDLLRYQLRAELPADEAVIVARAADWHLARGDVQAAIEMLIRIHDWDRVLETALRRSPEFFERGQIATIVRWLQSVPEPMLTANVDAVLCLGVLTGLLGQGSRAEDMLSQVANRADATAGQIACAETFRAALVQTTPHPARSFASAHRALELLAANGDGALPDILHLTTRRSLETIAIVSGGRALFLSNDIDAAQHWFHRALASDGAEYSLWRINVLGSQAIVDAWAGRLPAAEAGARDALATAREVGLTSHWGTADAYLALAFVAIEKGQSQQAAITLHEAHLRAESVGRTQQLWVCHLARALLLESNGSNQPQSTPPGPPPAVVDDRLKALRYRIRSRNGLTDISRTSVPANAQHCAAQLIEIANSAVSQSRPDVVHTCLRLLDADVGDTPLWRVQRDLLLARVAKADGNSGKSARHIASALEEAGDEGLVEVFVRFGAEMLSLVAATAETNNSIRAAILDRAAAAAIRLPGAELQTPLTKRETELLSYLPSYYTNQELAEMCFVSVNTIKTHMVHIYQKLNAPNRSAAVVRAREIGLI